VAELLDDGRDAEGLERGDFGGDQPEHGGQAVLLFQVVAAEAGILVHFVGEVEVAGLEVALERGGFADFGEEVAEGFAAEEFLIGNGGNRPVNPDLGWLALGKVEVGTFAGNEVTEVCVDLMHGGEVLEIG